MAMGDRIKNTGKDVAGKAKEQAGKATGNRDLEREGRADQAGAQVKNAGEREGKDANRDNHEQGAGAMTHDGHS